MNSATSEIAMSNAAATSKFSFYQAVIPAGILILSGLSLAYSLQAGGTNASNAVASPEPVAIAQSPYPEPIANRQAEVIAARSNTRSPAFNSSAGETAPDLMRLHKRIADARAEQADSVRLMAEIDRLHKAEPVDAAWSAQSETAVLSTTTQPLLAQSGLKPQDLATDCRSSTCRISARFAQSTDAESWAQMMVTEMAGTMSQARMAVVQLPDGSSEVHIYGVRKGAPRG
jgi:hypothetical protein